MFLKSSGEDKGELLSFDDLFPRALYDPPGITGRKELRLVSLPSTFLTGSPIKIYPPLRAIRYPFPGGVRQENPSSTFSLKRINLVPE
jgi:hypothetical protein